MWLVKYFRKKNALRELLPAAAPSAAPQVPAPHDSVPVPEESLARGKARKGERERGVCVKGLPCSPRKRVTHISLHGPGGGAKDIQVEGRAGGGENRWWGGPVEGRPGDAWVCG